jgi:hypothetical protein
MVFSSAPATERGLKIRTAIRMGCAVLATCAVAQAAPNSPPEPADGNGPTRDQAPSKEQCVESHRLAQQAQNEGKLVHARELARTCTALACPGLIISDCARWLNDLDQRIPSVVFEVRVDGEPNLTATVLADGARVNEWTRGEAFRVDPGEHQFRFELGDFAPITQKVLLAEGMRYRAVSVEFKTDSRSTAPVSLQPSAPLAPSGTQSSPAPPARPVPVIVYPLLGLGAVGVGSFTVFALMGNSKKDKLETSCKPNCTDSDLKPMKTSYLVADISLGVGVASLVAAGIFYIGRPQEKPPSTQVSFAPLPGGGAGSFSYSF